jgi:Putative adhesin
MSELAAPQRGRSGCALFLGVLLIATGVLFLAQNLIDLPLLPLFRRTLSLFIDYWPVLLVAWGALKIYQRFAQPERARVGASEIVLLVFIVLCGLALSGARRVLERVSGERLEEIVGFSDASLLGAPSHRFPAEARFEIGGATELAIVNPGGEVKILGGDGAQIEVSIVKRVRDESEAEASAIAERVELDFDASGPKARLSVALPEGKTPVECDLEVRLPRTFAVSLTNRRGRVSALDIDGAVRIETAHDGIDAENLGGGLKATTRHGEIRVRGIAGTVELESRGGSILAEDIEGELRAETSHGRLVAEDVSGNATLENRHAPVTASRIGGELRVSAQNAEVSVESALSSVAVANRHGSIFVRDVRGDLTIDAMNAPIQARDIAGNVNITNRDQEVTLVKVRGSARVTSPLSSVVVEEVEGPIEIESSNEDVRVLAFGSNLTVRSTHAPLSVATSRLAGNVILKTTYGDVELRLPRGASLSFEGLSEDGELHSSFPELEIAEDRRGAQRLFRGTLGSSTHSVKVETSYGDIRLEPVES